MPLTPEQADRAAAAYDLRRQGRTYREVAEALGVSVAWAHELVQTAIKARIPEAAEETRQLEVDRYDAWLYRLEQRLEKGADPEKVIPILLKVSERRAKLMGLDAPKRVRVTDERPPAPEFADAVKFAERQADIDEDAIRSGEDSEHEINREVS